MKCFRLAFFSSALTFQSFGVEAAQAPGPDPLLFHQPYYACIKNYYVSATGSDSNGGTQQQAPWRTLQHANNALPSGGAAAGSCINVAPGTYSGVEITKGGNVASARGYVVYRCTTMDACTVKGDAGEHGAEAFETQENTFGTPPNYVMIDGFDMAGFNSSSNGVGVSSWNGNDGPDVSTHHLWVLNSIIGTFGQSGIGVAASEYYYFIHNRVYGNSNLQCNWQGSGIAINVMHSVPDYKPTPDDLKNPNVLLGPSWEVRKTFFHNVIAWNVILNNALTHCGTADKPTDTDGNGIILDSNLTGNGDTQNYLSPSLVAFNLVYNNGGSGIHLFYSANVTVANNSCYNNEIDPGNGGTGRACMDDSNGYADTFINNIAVALPAQPSGKCWPAASPFERYNFAMLGSPARAPYDVFRNNITHVIGSTCNGAENSVYHGDIFSCSGDKNKCATSPSWMSVGNKTVGTETAPPQSANFALKPGSAAIGYGLREPYLPSQSVDVGACSHIVTICN